MSSTVQPASDESESGSDRACRGPDEELPANTTGMCHNRSKVQPRDSPRTDRMPTHSRRRPTQNSVPARSDVTFGARSALDRFRERTEACCSG
jgi:hypothetical protein